MPGTCLSPPSTHGRYESIVITVRSHCSCLTVFRRLVELGSVKGRHAVGSRVRTALSAGGVFVSLSVPLTGATPFNTVGADNFNTPNLYAFSESQNILLGSSLVMDIGVAIAAGTQVASHYVFFDPLAASSMVGTVDFDSDVLGIITSSGLLLLSDGLANTGVTYLNPVLRGLEAGDSVTISGTRQVLLKVTASSPGDCVRVITAFSPGAVPEPMSLAMVGAALAALALTRRRKA